MSAASDGPAPFPWGEAMALGLGRMRLSPQAFWAMTPRELAAAAGFCARAGTAPGRAGLAELMERFPDRRREERHGR